MWVGRCMEGLWHLRGCGEKCDRALDVVDFIAAGFCFGEREKEFWSVLVSGSDVLKKKK